MTKVSIITINLNNESGLRKTMESVILQEYPDFEYIIMDGGSTDGSVQLIQELHYSFDRHIHWKSEPDSGIYQAMNKGIRMSVGEYLLFLNSGDFLVDNHVLMDVFSQEHAADFLLGRCRLSDNGKIVHVTSPPSKLTFGYLYWTGLPHQATFIKREMFEKHGLYREDFRFNADIDFWYRTIVLQNSSTETLENVISDYNLDGISSKLLNSEAYKREMEEIKSNPFLQLFIPDYEEYRKERNEMKALYWIKSKRIFYSLITGLFALATKISAMKKKLCAA
jgi:glycosyltransferase involved in cell wall biosynthesis